MDKNFRIRRRGLRIVRDASVRSWVKVSPLWLAGFGMVCAFAGMALSVPWLLAIVEHVAVVRY